MALSGPNYGVKPTERQSNADSTEASSQTTQHKQTQTHQSPTRRGASSLRRRTASQGPYKASKYERHSDHIPHTSSPSEEAYILSLKTDKAHHDALTALRDRYLPRHLNKLSAHIAIFRALPGSKLEETGHDISALSQEQHVFSIKTSSPFRLKHGVGIQISPGADEAQAVFEDLRSTWVAFLSKQDNGRFRAHYTIMNKVDDEEEIGNCLDEVKRSFEANKGVIEGLKLWRYEKGYWKFERTWDFSDRK